LQRPEKVGGDFERRIKLSLRCGLLVAINMLVQPGSFVS
jgi:hypothetical protein